MTLADLAVLAADTVRTKAYLQGLAGENLLPSLCIVYTDDPAGMAAEAERYRREEHFPSGKYFDRDVPLLYTLEREGIPYRIIGTADINSEEMGRCIGETEQEYLIYSGYGGSILKPHLFRLGKKYLHVHAGLLPGYRGSTTAYYSLLQEGVIGASAIFLDEGLDTGRVIVRDVFRLPEEPVDIDYVYEPYVRTRVLLQAVRLYARDGCLEAHTQGAGNAETYFIIHPVLKHAALLGAERYWKGRAG